jgi:E3 ubiquitin-protein ligase HERC1
VLGPIVASCRFAVAISVKLAQVKALVIDGVQRSGDCPTVRLNRFAASQYFATGRGTPLVGQLISQIPPESDAAWALNRASDRPWKVDLVGEGATDAGGPGRVLFSDVAMEFLRPELKLFVPTPNGRRGDFEVRYVPHPDPVEPFSMREKMYVYVGLWLAIAYISRLPQPMHLANVVWKALTDAEITVDDVCEIDSEFAAIIASVPEGQTFEVQDAAGRMTELFPGGSATRVTAERRAEFVRRCSKFRLAEFAGQLAAVKRGFARFFNPVAAGLLSPWELELLCCGRPEFSVEELKAHCEFTRGDPVVEMLWRVLEGFSHTERCLFVKFASGRMSLPAPGIAWERPLRIEVMRDDGKPEEKKGCPTAQTCSYRIALPHYKTEEVMARRIRTAILMAGDIEQDHRANYAAVSEFT